MSGSLKKLNLITVGFVDFNYDHVEWIFRDYFNFKPFDPNETYNKETDILVVSRPFHWNEQNWNNKIQENVLDKGVRVILADLWEARPYFSPANDLAPYLDNVLVMLGCKNSLDTGWHHHIDVPNWFWYNEHLIYTCDWRCKGYETYQPNRKSEKLFLMPMHRAKLFRNEIADRFEPLLENSVWSYVQSYDRGCALPRFTQSDIEQFMPDRIFESEWYDQTCFTLAIETAVDRQLNPKEEIEGQRKEAYPCELFVTEKTFKPIAFRHPFQVIGMKGTLDFLHDIGFETYENIFNESYDSLDFFHDRMDVIYQNCEQFNKDTYLDKITEQKLEHNHQRFYNRQLVLDGVKQDLIEPLLEWINQ